MPDQVMLINTIVLQEVKDSSEIENIISTQDLLYKALCELTYDGPALGIAVVTLQFFFSLEPFCSKLKKAKRISVYPAPLGNTQIP